MLIEVHRVVQEPDDLERTRGGHSIEQDMAGIPARLLDVAAQDSGPGAPHFASLRLGGDGVQSLADEVTVLPSLFLAPPRSRVYLRTSTMSRLASGERNTRAIRRER